MYNALYLLATCLEVMQHIFEAGGAAEGHDNCIVVPSNQNLTETHHMLSLWATYDGKRNS